MASTDTAVTAVTVVDQGWEPRTLALLEQYPTARFNLLVPTVSLRQVNPYLVPDIEVVQLNPDPEAGEIYHSEDMKAGYFAPTKVGLRKLADVAAINRVDSRRLDDGSDPDYLEWQVRVQMAHPSGRTVEGLGSKAVDLRERMTKSWTPQRLAKAREHQLANAESKAMNRAIRDLLSLRAAYPRAELAKPFAVLRYVPDMSHPEVRQRFLDLVAPVSAQLFGPAAPQASGIKLVGPGVDEVERVHVPQEDDDPAPKAREASDGPVEPDWFPAGAPAPASAEPTFADRIRAAAADPDAPKGAAAKPLMDQLRAVATPIGGSAFTAGFAALWPNANVNAISAAQARAIVLAANADEAFAQHWAELAGAGSAAA